MKRQDVFEKVAGMAMRTTQVFLEIIRFIWRYDQQLRGNGE
jgi:hypothetical protein